MSTHMPLTPGIGLLGGLLGPVQPIGSRGAGNPIAVRAMSDGELLLVIGPPAVGKMTVGRAVCARTDFRLFHNHHTIEPLLEIFGFGTAPFSRSTAEFRRRVIEEAAAVGHPADLHVRVERRGAGGCGRGAAADRAVRRRRRCRSPSSSCTPTCATRLERNVGEDRIPHKRSKRDLAWSDAHVRELDAAHVHEHPTPSGRPRRPTRCSPASPTCGSTTRGLTPEAVGRRDRRLAGRPTATDSRQLIRAASRRRRTLCPQAFEPSSAASLRKNSPAPTRGPTRTGRVGPSQP